ncbi:hypothetical protein [Conexibacter sp. CPCC 206217]|uniref:hypothetical protein n=1 Tax=Conexibacter sp. CPCC 206217 TaxID=3064574 RepID=UPI00271C0B5C|nr:hypothetical protein [Conexibacter sp. CPCC 206217]MDO8213058.1 hypothetical protein [Conexibacter sp. CPCC 206217]
MGFLKNVALAFKPSNFMRGIDAARNGVDQAQIEASLASLTPEQRAAYDANMAQVEQGRAASQAAWEEAKRISEQTRVLEGPAGRYVHGAGIGDFASPAEIEASMMQQGTLPVVRELRAQRKGEFKQALRQSFGIQEVKQVSDPVERARLAAEERRARDLIRAPFAAPDAVPTAISRIATRGETQLAELLAYLRESGLAARPDLIFGVYRVPDRISGPVTPYSERGRVVEWDVVHAAGAAGGPSAAPLVATSFRGEDRWVARRLGEPSVLDEDLALAFCLAAGIGPERCAGLARISEFRALKGSGSDDSAGELVTLVKGIVALHPQESSGTFARMRDAAPVALAPDQLADAGIHVEVLNWEAIGRAVHLKVHHPPPVPSPFPYLPATPQELLRAYLEVVGLRPQDSYSAQATVDRPSPLVQGGFMSTNVGPKQPCADGKDRMRTHGCQHVVFVYRDRPEYAAGRERWAAYESEILQARLGNGLGLRPPLAAVDDDLAGLPAIVRPVARVAELIDRLDAWGGETVPPHRYCWPAIDQG